MKMRKFLVDDTRRELSAHGTDGFPMTVKHDDLWTIEGKRVPVHWHSDLEICLPREGEVRFQIYQDTYTIRPGEGFLLNRNVPHSCQSPNHQHTRYSTILVHPEFLYGELGSDVERNCFRPFLQNSLVPCIPLHAKGQGVEILEKLNQVEQIFDEKSYCYELRIKGLLCEVFSLIFCENREKFTTFLPANQLELERVEKILTYLNLHYDAPVSLQEVADQIHVSREVCCRLFKKMTGKTITTYLEEYRVTKSIPMVQSGQYSMIQIADMTGFSNASRFAGAFRKQIGCNPGEYNSLKRKHS